MSDLRTLQRFLQDKEGVYTVSTTVPPSTTLVCDCQQARPCAHVKWVEARKIGALYPLNLTTKVTEAELTALLDGPLEDYERFVSRNGKVEVL